VVVRALVFGAGLAVLGLVVALLSLVIHRFSSGSTPEWVFLVLGLLAGGGTLGVGAVGARTMAEVSRRSGDDARAAMSRAIRAVLPFELVGYGASLVAIVLVIAR
jgi:hypothetical protein